MTGAATRGTAVVGAAGLDPSIREGEERHTRGRKARPPWVFTMLEPEKEKKWREGGVGGVGDGGGDFRNLKRGCEMKKKERKGVLYREGGGGGMKVPI